MASERGDNYVGGYSKRYTQDKAVGFPNSSVIREVKPSENKRKFVKTLVIFFGVVVIVAMILGIIYFLGGFEKSISDSKLLEGATLDLKENNSLSFGFGEEDHGIKLGFVGLDSVDLTISSAPINISLRINEIKEVDIDGDGVVDIMVKLIQIVDGKATIAVRRVQQNRCLENWRCTEWDACENGIQERECVDLNECGGNFGKPPARKKCLEMESVDWTDTGNWSGSRLFGTVKEASENRERVEEKKENQTDNLENESEENNLEDNSNDLDNETLNNSTDLNETSENDTEDDETTGGDNSEEDGYENILDCGTFDFNSQDTSQMDCLINASESCTPAKVLVETSAEVFGIAYVESTQLKEVKGLENGKCEYYTIIQDYDFSYTEDGKQALIDQGYAESEIPDLEEEQKELSLGLNDTCLFETSDLVNLLNNEKEGSFSSSDWDVADCVHGIWSSTYEMH